MVTDGFLMWSSFAIILCSVVAFAIDKWSIETVSLATIAAFLGLFSAFPSPNINVLPHELVIGFANPALITVICLLMIGRALFNTDALHTPTRLLARMGGGGMTQTLLILLVVAAVLSAFMNNTPVVVMFIPIIVAIAAQRNFDAAKGLMPLSYISILGGMTTLIGSSTNLLVAEVAASNDIEIGFFDFTIPGLMIAGVGAIYVIFIMPLLLKKRPGIADNEKATSGQQYISQIDIVEGHPLLGIHSKLGLFAELSDMTVRMVLRNGQSYYPPFEDITIGVGDKIIVSATRDALTKALSQGTASIPEHPKDEVNEPGQEIEADFHLAEVVVAPGSRYVGRTVQGANIRFIENVMVMGVQRKSRMQRKAFHEIRLEPGDTLLVGGPVEDIGKLRTNKNLILLEWSADAVPLKRYAWRAIIIFLAVIGLASTGMLPIMVASVLGVLAMILAHCLNIRQAIQSFDGRIFMLVAAALAGAVALEKTGGAAFIAEWVITTFEGSSPTLILSMFFLATAILTNFLSNNATSVLFTPIAIRVAEGIGVPAEAFIVGVIFAANCSFATPVGYQTNLLVLGPGHYKFSDFIIVGTPLVILIWLTYSFVGPWYYGI